MADVPEDLKDLYVDELKDLWSANEPDVAHPEKDRLEGQ